jgi:hypothetical protein
VHYRPILKKSLAGCRKTAPEAVIQRCGAFVNAHLSSAHAALSKTPHALADGLMLVL